MNICINVNNYILTLVCVFTDMNEVCLQTVPTALSTHFVYKSLYVQSCWLKCSQVVVIVITIINNDFSVFRHLLAVLVSSFSDRTVEDVCLRLPMCMNASNCC